MRLLARITSKHFVAGIELENDVVVRTAPIVRFMMGWSRDNVRSYCKSKGWTIEVVSEIPNSEFNGAKAKQARDEGMERVKANNTAFRDDIALFIDTKLPRGWEGIGEDIRRLWNGIQPHHPNCWGAVCNAAIKRGTLVKIPNAMRRPQAVKSHSRPTHVFRKV